MILNESINKENITFNKPLYYSNNYTFIKINYNKKDILIQTPNLYCKYGLNNRHYNIDVSFQNIDNDNNVKLLKNNLELIYKIIKKRFKKYNIIYFLKDKIWMRLKFNNNLCIFNQTRQKIDTSLSNTYAKYIINLRGLWLINNNDIYIQFYVLQIKVDKQIILDEYAFIDNKIKRPIPPPPPLPIFKKTKPFKIIKNNNNKIIREKTLNPPSLNEIKNALSNLKKLK